MPRKAPTYTPVHVPEPEAPVEPTPTELLADGVLPVNEAARFLGHSRSWLLREINAGTIPSMMFGRRRVIARRVLVAYLTGQMANAKAG